MPTDGLVPAYVQIAYHSGFGQHMMTLPTRELTTTGLGDPGSYEAWDFSTIAADVMVEALIDELGLAVPSSIIFDNYTIFRKPTTLDDAQPVFTKTYPVTGAETGLTGQARAVQVTLSFRTEGFGQARLVVLDRPVNGNFGSFIDPTGDFEDVIAEFTAVTNAWSGRDGFRPAAYTNTSISLNKRLRRKYGMI